MKKLLAFLISFLFAVPAFGQAQQQTFTRIRDGSVATQLANVYQFDLTFATTRWGLHVLAGLYAYDGTQMKRLKLDAMDGLYTGRTWTIAGEDAGNDYTKIKKQDTEPVHPGVESTANIGTDTVTILASREVLTDVNWCIYIENTGGGGDPLTDADVEVSPDGTTWIDLGWSDCDALADGDACVYCVSNNAYRYIRVRAAAADANQTNTDCWYTGNKN